MGMTSAPHLTADDLDALLTESARTEAVVHVGACDACFEMARRDRDVVAALGTMPLLSPRADFADRVMSRVTVTRRLPFGASALTRLPSRLFANRRTLALAATWTLVVGTAMVASVLWSLSNRALLASWGDQLLAEGSQWFWLGLRGLAANLAEQPWYEQARAIVTSPGRLTGVLAGITVAYASGILALKHLVAIPTRPVHDARA